MLYERHFSGVGDLNKSFLALVGAMTAESFQAWKCGASGKQLNETHCPFHKTVPRDVRHKLNFNLSRLQK